MKRYPYQQKVHRDKFPRCRICQRIGILSPCRKCATPEQLAKYPPLPTKETDERPLQLPDV